MITFKKTPDKYEYGKTYDPIEVVINIDNSDLCRQDLFEVFCQFLKAAGYYVGPNPCMFDDEDLVREIDEEEPEGTTDCECSRCDDCTCMADNGYEDDHK